MIVYSILKKIDWNLEALKEENTNPEWIQVVEEEKALISGELSSTVARLIEQGFSLASLNNY